MAGQTYVSCRPRQRRQRERSRRRRGCGVLAGVVPAAVVTDRSGPGPPRVCDRGRLRHIHHRNDLDGAVHHGQVRAGLRQPLDTLAALALQNAIPPDKTRMARGGPTRGAPRPSWLRGGDGLACGSEGRAHGVGFPLPGRVGTTGALRCQPDARGVRAGPDWACFADADGFLITASRKRSTA